MKKPLHFILSLALVVLYIGSALAQNPSNYLKHKWTFVENMNDAIGGANGTAVGGAFALNGLNLTVNGDCIELPAAKIAINKYTEVSFEISYTASELKTNCMVYYFGNSTNNYGNEGVFLAPNHWDGPSIRAAISTGTYTDGPWTNETAVKTAATVAGTKYHVVTTINATDLKLYVNGALIGTALMAEKNNTLAGLSNAFAWVGRGGYSSDPTFLGVIHKLAIYNKALADDEVLALFNATYAEDFAANRFNPVVISKNGNIMISLKGTGLNHASAEVYNLGGSKINGVKSFYGETSIPSNRGIYLVKVFDGMKSSIQKVAVR